jgi:hypothetical protein
MTNIIEINNTLYQSNYDIKALTQVYHNMCKVLGFRFDTTHLTRFEDLLELNPDHLFRISYLDYQYNNTDETLKVIIDGLLRIGLSIPEMLNLTYDEDDNPNHEYDPCIEYTEEFVEWLEDKLSYMEDLLIECLTTFDKDLTLTRHNNDAPSLLNSELSNNTYYKYKE